MSSKKIIVGALLLAAAACFLLAGFKVGVPRNLSLTDFGWMFFMLAVLAWNSNA